MVTPPRLRSRTTRNATLVAVASTALFAVAALMFIWITAALRFSDMSAARPRLQAAYDRASEAIGQPREVLTFGPDDPAQHIDTILVHVATLTLVFACVVAVMTVLVTYRRTGFALLAVAAATASAALGAGPLSLLAGTVSASATSVYGTQVASGGSPAGRQAFVDFQNSSIAFITPTWLRLAVASGIALILVATFLVLRRATGDGVANPTSTRITGALALGCLLIVGLLGIGDTTTLTIDGVGLIALLASCVGFGVATAVAGASLASRRAALTGLGLTLLIGGTTYAMWAAHARPGGAPQVFGFVDMGSDAPVFGTPLLTAAILAALPSGWVCATVANRFTGRTSRAAKPLTAS
jgi:hypothetical protein